MQSFSVISAPLCWAAELPAVCERTANEFVNPFEDFRSSGAASHPSVPTRPSQTITALSARFTESESIKKTSNKNNKDHEPTKQNSPDTSGSRDTI